MATIRMKGLRCVACQICEKECPPQCIYIVKEQGQEAGLHRQTAVLSDDVRHRYLGLHELPDLRRGLPVRRDQDGHGIRVEHHRPFRAACSCNKTDLAKSNEYYHKIHPTEASEVDERLAAEKAKAEAKAKADAEAKAKAAAAATVKPTPPAVAPTPAPPVVAPAPAAAPAPTAPAPAPKIAAPPAAAPVVPKPAPMAKPVPVAAG